MGTEEGKGTDRMDLFLGLLVGVTIRILKHIHYDISLVTVYQRVTISEYLQSPLKLLPHHHHHISFNGMLEVNPKSPTPCRQCAQPLTGFGGVLCDAKPCRDDGKTCYTCLRPGCYALTYFHPLCLLIP